MTRRERQRAEAAAIVAAFTTSRKPIPQAWADATRGRSPAAVGIARSKFDKATQKSMG